jgi:uncharacterized protein (TIGR02466 family)
MSTIAPPRNVQVHDLFPSPVWMTELEDFDDHNRRMLEYLEELRARDQGLKRSNVLGWHSPDNLQTVDEFQPLRREVLALIENDVSSLLRLDTDRYEYHIDSMWAMHNGKHAYNFVHRHPGCIYSGVYYLQCAENAGSLNFHDPRADVRMLRPPALEEVSYTYHIVRYAPVRSRLVVFPAWLPHDVGPNLSDTARVAVSFNVVHRPRGSGTSAPQSGMR